MSEFTKVRRKLRSRDGTDHEDFWQWACETVASYSVQFDVVLKRLMCCHGLLGNIMVEAHTELRPLLARMRMANGGADRLDLPSGPVAVDLKRTGSDATAAMLSEIAHQQQKQQPQQRDSSSDSDTGDDADDDDAQDRVVECVSLLREIPIADHHLTELADPSATYPCGHTQCVYAQAPMVIRTASCNTTYYEPCKIIGLRRVGRGVQYRVHMRGFASPAGDEWILARTIREHYPTLLEEFEAEAAAAVSTQPPQPPPPPTPTPVVESAERRQQRPRVRASNSKSGAHLVHAGVATLPLTAHPRTKRRRGVRIVMTSSATTPGADDD